MKRRYKRRYKNKSFPLSSIIFLLLIVLCSSEWSFGEIQVIAFGIIAIVAGIVVFRLFSSYQKKQAYLRSGIKNVDKMTGAEFEEFLKAHFERLGYHAKLTPASNDYGADLVLKKNGEVTVVQAKRYQAKLGVQAIQEVNGAKGYYGAKKGMVVTNSYFTPNAVSLANANQIELWDRNVLVKVMMHENVKECIKLK